MPCFHPRDVWLSPRFLTKNGKSRVFFRRPFWAKKSYYERIARTSSVRLANQYFRFNAPEQSQVPGCKPKCVGCQETYARSWAVRAWHESQCHDDNCFITLTFNDKYVPKELDHRFWQLFMKRFRRKISQPVSFFMAGEYGSLNFRPHFHACIFGYDFHDRVLFSVSNDVRLYTSAALASLWSDPKTGESYGFSSVGDVTFESAAYIARYVGKKAGRSAAELDGRKPEYSKCSLKRPIGKEWISAYLSSVFPDDSVTMQGGRKVKPPRYYDKFLDLTDKELSDSIKAIRKDKAKASPDNSPARLLERESVKKAQFAQLKRSL